MNITRCPNENELSCFIENQLSRWRTKKVVKHIRNCLYCQEVIINTKDIILDEKEKNPEAVPEYLKNEIIASLHKELISDSLDIEIQFKGTVLERWANVQQIISIPKFNMIYRSSGLEKKNEFRIHKKFKDIETYVSISKKFENSCAATLAFKGFKNDKSVKKIKLDVFFNNQLIGSKYLTKNKSHIYIEQLSIGKYRFEVAKLEENIDSQIGTINLFLKKNQ